MFRGLNKTVLSSVCFETVQVCQVMQAGLVAGRFRHRVQRLIGNAERHLLSIILSQINAME